MELLIATGNPGKVREYDELFAGLPITCIGPADLGIRLDVEIQIQGVAKSNW